MMGSLPQRTGWNTQTGPLNPKAWAEQKSYYFCPNSFIIRERSNFVKVCGASAR